MRNQHKLILSNDELLNSKLRDEFISNLKKEGFLSRKIFFYKKGIKEEINIENQQGSLFSEKEIIDLRLQEKSILKDDLDFFLSLLGDDNSDRIVVISSINKKIKTSAWFKKISKYLEISEISSNLIVSSLFTVTSFATTTGFTVLDHTSFPTYLPQLLIFIGMIGACAGSTAGGFKAIRGLVLLNHARRELKKLIHPNLVLPLKIGKKKINNEVADSVWGFLTVYLLTFLVGSFILMGQGIDTETAFSAIAACLNNLGPGLGEVAYNYAGMDAFTKVLLAFVMILGRLEIYTLLVLFTAFFWKE